MSRRIAQAYAGTPIVDGNLVTILRNGDELFPAILAAIRGARRTITYAQYYWDRGAVGQQLADTIAERCRAGVGVLLDAFGTLAMPDDHRETLERSGCHVVQFHPLTDVARLNHRNHQRILVVDGTIGFTGGWGVGRRWTGHGREVGHGPEMDVRVEGPVVFWLQSTFVRAWADTTGVMLDDPEHGETKVYTMLLLAIGAAS